MGCREADCDTDLAVVKHADASRPRNARATLNVEEFPRVCRKRCLLYGPTEDYSERLAEKFLA
jgi:hypothetical protein